MGITLRYIKPLFYWMPELYLILATIFYWVSTATLLNPIAFILLVLIVSQLIFNKKEDWSPLTEALLHISARNDHLEKIVKPNLKKGI